MQLCVDEVVWQVTELVRTEFNCLSIYLYIAVFIFLCAIALSKHTRDERFDRKPSFYNHAHAQKQLVHACLEVFFSPKSCGE